MVGTPPDAFASAGFAHPTAVPERHYFSAPCPRAAPGEAARRSRVDTPPSADYNAALARPRLRARRGAQVAQLVEHATENRSVGGSIPPLGTIRTAIFRLSVAGRHGLPCTIESCSWRVNLRPFSSHFLPYE